MGPTIKYTNRLVLKVENESKAEEVLALYQRNRLNFERFEPTRPSNFYTLDYHTTMLRREYKAYMAGSFLRYYIYKSNNTSRIIGAVNFNLMYDREISYTDPDFFTLLRNTPYAYAEIGYKIDALYQNQGMAYEACTAGIEVITKEYGIKRIDARIHPDNIASQKLASKMGFIPFRLEPESANIMGRYVDLIRYTLDTSDIQ